MLGHLALWKSANGSFNNTKLASESEFKLSKSDTGNLLSSNWFFNKKRQKSSVADIKNH